MANEVIKCSNSNGNEKRELKTRKDMHMRFTHKTVNGKI